MGRVVAPGDPAWTEDDTLLALEWQDWSSQICPGCGHHLTDSTDEANHYETRDRVCFACEAKEQHVKELQENERAVTAGRKVGVVLIDRDN
jgi:hypothetical protein